MKMIERCVDAIGVGIFMFLNMKKNSRAIKGDF
mgnify:CR=1 FL=1